MGETKYRGAIANTTAILVAVTVVIFGANYAKYGSATKPFVQPHIQAPIFQWTRGCIKKSYSAGDKISRDCMDPKNSFSQYRDFGFPTFRTDHYFRVGDDIIDIDCGWSECHAVVVIRDAFFR